jgi:Na+/H+-dicarboxylate symporter
MSGQVIFFSVVLGAAAVRMDSKVPVLERYLL